MKGDRRRFRRVVLTLLSLAACYAVYSYLLFGVPVVNIRVCGLPKALSLGDQPFDAAMWRNSPERRANMLRSLGSGASFKGRTPQQITELLGPGDCYANYEDVPCYDAHAGDSQSHLVFHVAHSGAGKGTVTSVTLQQNSGDLAAFFRLNRTLRVPLGREVRIDHTLAT